MGQLERCPIDELLCVFVCPAAMKTLMGTEVISDVGKFHLNFSVVI